MKSKYNVCLKEPYINSTQMCETRSLSDEEFADFEPAADYAEPLWTYIQPKHLVATVDADSAQQAILAAAEREDFDPRVLTAEPVEPCTPLLYYVNVTVEALNVPRTAYGIVLANDPEQARDRIYKMLPGVYAEAIGSLTAKVKVLDITHMQTMSPVCNLRYCPRVEFVIV